MDSALKTSATSPSAPMDPFRAHIVGLSSMYELGPFPGATTPWYEAPTDWLTEYIKSLGAMAHRMYSAEETRWRSPQTIGPSFTTLILSLNISQNHYSRNAKLLSRSFSSKALYNSLLSGKRLHRLQVRI